MRFIEAWRVRDLSTCLSANSPTKRRHCSLMSLKLYIKRIYGDIVSLFMEVSIIFTISKKMSVCRFAVWHPTTIFYPLSLIGIFCMFTCCNWELSQCNNYLTNTLLRCVKVVLYLYWIKAKMSAHGVYYPTNHTPLFS